MAGQDQSNDQLNIETNGFWIIIFYIISGIILIGTLFQLLLLIPSAEKFYIIVIKKYKPVYIITYILQLLSIIYFPIVSFYIFTTFYVNKKKTLF